MTPDDERHGTAAGYAAGCHELCCRSAHTRLQKRRRHDRLHGHGWRQSAIGTQRRIQALYALGWRSKDIAPLVGVNSGEAVHNLTTRDYVSKSVRDRIAVAYDTLSMSIGPSDLNRKRAAAKGWPPPLAWTDIDDPQETPVMVNENGYTRWDSFENRFWGQIEKTETCWLWTGKLNAKGYGRTIGYQGSSIYPHRVSYMIAVGPIPDGLVIDHLCRNRACVNPDHLEPVTAEENTRRGAEARWTEPCPNGHNPEQFRTTLPSGKTICVECRRVADRARYERDGEKRRAAGAQQYIRRRKQVDAVVVERAMSGERVHANAPEREEVIRRWLASGRSAKSLEELQGWNVKRDEKRAAA